MAFSSNMYCLSVSTLLFAALFFKSFGIYLLQSWFWYTMYILTINLFLFYKAMIFFAKCQFSALAYMGSLYCLWFNFSLTSTLACHIAAALPTCHATAPIIWIVQILNILSLPFTRVCVKLGGGGNKYFVRRKYSEAAAKIWVSYRYKNEHEFNKDFFLPDRCYKRFKVNAKARRLV